MKMYDFAKVKDVIETSKSSIDSASMGMYEDWFWTAETVFEEGEYTVNLDEITKIGGIDGSSWATPVVIISYKNGLSETIPCYEGVSSGASPFGPSLTGPLSSAAQETLPPLKEIKN